MLSIRRNNRTATRGTSRENGFTLVELVVAMTIAGIVGSLMVSWFVSASDTFTAMSNSSAATADARGALQSWAGYLHAGTSPKEDGSGADRIVAASLTPTSIAFEANLHNDMTCQTSGSCPALTPTLVTLSLTGDGSGPGDLVEQVGSGSASYVVPGNVVSTGTITADNPFGNCLFTVSDSSGPLGCTGLTQAQLDGVTSVTLSFVVTPKTGHARSYSTTAAFTTSSANGT